MNSSTPPGFPYKWCNCGEDKYGIWIQIKINQSNTKMRWMKPGEFVMGSPDDELHRYEHETNHEVSLTKGFWISDTTCTQETWENVMKSNPSKNTGPQKPVDNISFNDCKKFFEKVNELNNKIVFSLPTESQWEYACRAGTQTPFSFGINISPDQVNYNGEHPYIGQEKQLNRNQTLETKALPANPWGLYEMHGNVWEWCSDWFAQLVSNGVTDPAGPSNGLYKILRGGSAFSGAADCRSAARIRFHPNERYYRNGFRFICVIKEDEKKAEYKAHERIELPQDEEELTSVSENREIIMKKKEIEKNEKENKTAR